MRTLLHTNNKNCRSKLSVKQSGFSLIEVMVAALVLSIGILGVASLQIVGLKGSHQSYMKIQAMAVVQSLSERMHANKLGVINGSYVDSSSGFTCGEIEDCSFVTANCNSTDIAKIDLDNLICGHQSGNAPRVGGIIRNAANDKSVFVDGELDITCPDDDCSEGEVTISMQWQERKLGKENPGVEEPKDSIVLNTRIFK